MTKPHSKPSKEKTSAADAGRLDRRRKATRARLLEAGYEIMSASGVDAAKIKDITDHADIGFGTFYNYFESKDVLAAQVLDCVIDDFGRRNLEATRNLHKKWDAATVAAVSIRLWLRAVMADAMWQWWAKRPDLLANRLRKGFAPYAKRDMIEGAAKGIFQLNEQNIDRFWGLVVWIMVGGLHAVAIGDQLPDSEKLIAESIMRLLGVPVDTARRISSTSLPKYPRANIDWTFQLEPHALAPASAL